MRQILVFAKLVKTALKTLEFQKLSNKSSLKGPEASQKQKTTSRDNHGHYYYFILLKKEIGLLSHKYIESN